MLPDILNHQGIPEPPVTQVCILLDEKTLHWIRTSGFPPSNWHREVVSIILINMAQVWLRHPVSYDYLWEFPVTPENFQAISFVSYQSIKWILIYNKNWISIRKKLLWNCDVILCLTLKHQETQGCVVSTVATDALVLKHQAISILSAD